MPCPTKSLCLTFSLNLEGQMCQGYHWLRLSRPFLPPMTSGDLWSHWESDRGTRTSDELSPLPSEPRDICALGAGSAEPP